MMITKKKKNNMINYLIIIPIHTFDDTVKELLGKAIQSVNITNCLIRLSTTKEIAMRQDFKDFKHSYKSMDVVYQDNDENDTTFYTLVNQAVDENYEWFSILEFDDEYTPIWFKNVERYLDVDQDYDILLPLVNIINYKTKKFIGFGNEPVWASSFSNEIGYVDSDCLKDFFSFYPTGGVFKTSTWLELGGLKNIPLSFWYELFLRYTKNNKKIFVIPRIGYKHYMKRDGSLLSIYEETITQEDSEKLFKQAKKECKTIIKPKYENIVKE